MNKIFSLFILLFSTLAFFSCDSKRSDDGDLLFGVDDIPVETGSTDKNIKRITQVYLGDSIIIDFEYTGSKITSIKQKYFGAYTTATLEYEGDTVAGLIVNSTRDNLPMVTDYDFTYMGNDLVKSVSQSKVGNDVVEKRESNLTYSGGKIFKVINSKINPNTNEEISRRVNDFLYSGGNLTFVRSTLYQGSNVLNTSEYTYSNFDMKKNPLTKMSYPLKVAFGTFVDFRTTTIQAGLSTNNFKNSKIVNNVGEIFTVTYDYGYDADKYPVSANSNTGLFIFEYQ